MRGGGSLYEATLHPSWTVGDKPNGGYLLALMARAASTSLAAEGVDQPDVLAATATYLRAPPVGRATVSVEVLRSGRRASQIRATMTDGARLCVDAVFTFGRLAPASTPRWSEPASTARSLKLPAEADCVRLPGQAPGGTVVSILNVTEVRLDPAVLGFASGRPGGSGELRGWMRFADGRQPDLLGLLYMVDGFPPSTFELGSTGWVPTLQLTVYLRAHPAPGPVMVRQRARLVEGGMVDEVCDVWDSGGHLVAQGVQLALVRFPDEPDPDVAGDAGVSATGPPGTSQPA